jgi:hypothetical protein
MTQFVHPLWSVVGRNYASLEADPPDGYLPRTEVHLVGEYAPIPVGVVETRRDYPWVLLHSIVEGEDDASHPSDRYIFVPESRIARVEIRYVRKGEFPIGFSVRDASEDVAA